MQVYCRMDGKKTYHYSGKVGRKVKVTVFI